MEVPEELLDVVGACEIDSRSYTLSGGGKAYRRWLDRVSKEFGDDLIPLTWVADYVGVSRMAVHKRVNSGYLTVLNFRLNQRIRTLTGTSREAVTELHSFAFRSECKEWIIELIEKARIKKRRHKTSKVLKVLDFIDEALDDFLEGLVGTGYDPRAEYEDNYL